MGTKSCDFVITFKVDPASSSEILKTPPVQPQRVKVFEQKLLGSIRIKILDVYKF
jgi:hypothetical protein